MTKQKLEDVIDFMEKKIPFNRYLGLVVTHLEPGFCILRIPWKDEFIGDPVRKAVHGGVLSTLIDTAGGAACWSMLKGEGDRLSTVDLRVDYLRRGPPADLLCEATVVRMGNRVSVARMEVFSAEGERKAIATGQGVYNIDKRS